MENSFFGKKNNVNKKRTAPVLLNTRSQKKIDIRDQISNHNNSYIDDSNEKKRAMSQTFNRFFTLKKLKYQPEKVEDTEPDEIDDKIIENQLNDIKTSLGIQQDLINDNSSRETTQHKSTPGLIKIENSAKDLSSDSKKMNMTNPKVLESWINETLLEVERQEQGNNVFITSERRIPLRNYGLDRQTLEGVGLPKEKIDRLYRSLFVYSAGFFELISGIFDHTVKKFNLVGSVWKVFWILLEYCYKADYQRILDEIQKDNQSIIKKLRVELDTKKNELETIEKWRDEILNKITYELNTLKMEKENLYREKLHLEQENKISDKAYSEEVQLRIKFENKINEIYAIHRDLKSKHAKTLEELSALQKDREIDHLAYSEIRNDYAIANAKITELSFTVKNLAERIASKELIIEDQTKLISELETKLTTALQTNEEINSKKTQYDFDDINFKAKTFAIINDSLKQNISQMQGLLEKGNKDKEELEKKIEDLELEIKEKDDLIAELELSALNLQNQLSEKNSQHDNLLSEHKKTEEEKDNLENSILQLRLKLETEIEKTEKLENQLANNLEMIKSSNKARDETSDLLKKAENKITEIIQENEGYETKLSKNEEMRDRLNLSIIELQDKIALMGHEIEQKDKELAHLRSIIDENKLYFKELIQNEKDNTEIWIEKYRIEAENVGSLSNRLIDLEDMIKKETFKKNNFMNKLDEIQRTIDQEKNTRMETSRINAELQQQIEKTERERLKYEKLYEEEKNKRTKGINEIIAYYEDTLYRLSKIEYPMVYEDLWSHAREYLEKISLIKSELEFIKTDNTEMKKKLHEYKISEENYHNQMLIEQKKSEAIIQANAILEKKCTELDGLNQILRNKNQIMTTEINQLKEELKNSKQKIEIEPLVSFRNVDKFLLNNNNNNQGNDNNHKKQNNELLHTQYSPHESNSTFCESYLTKKTINGIKDDINGSSCITKDFFLASIDHSKGPIDKQSGDFSIISSHSILQSFNRDIQSEDDRSLLETEGDNPPLRVEQFLMEEKKVKKVDQILNLAAKQAFYGLQRKGISFTPEPRRTLTPNRFDDNSKNLATKSSANFGENNAYQPVIDGNKKDESLNSDELYLKKMRNEHLIDDIGSNIPIQDIDIDDMKIEDTKIEDTKISVSRKNLANPETYKRNSSRDQRNGSNDQKNSSRDQKNSFRDQQKFNVEKSESKQVINGITINNPELKMKKISIQKSLNRKNLFDKKLIIITNLLASESYQSTRTINESDDEKLNKKNKEERHVSSQSDNNHANITLPEIKTKDKVKMLGHKGSFGIPPEEIRSGYFRSGSRESQLSSTNSAHNMKLSASSAHDMRMSLRQSTNKFATNTSDNRSNTPVNLILAKDDTEINRKEWLINKIGQQQSINTEIIKAPNITKTENLKIPNTIKTESLKTPNTTKAYNIKIPNTAKTDTSEDSKEERKIESRKRGISEMKRPPSPQEMIDYMNSPISLSMNQSGSMNQPVSMNQRVSMNQLVSMNKSVSINHYNSHDLDQIEDELQGNSNMIELLDQNLNKSFVIYTNGEQQQQQQLQQRHINTDKRGRTFIEKKENILNVFEVKRNEHIKDGIKKAIKAKNRIKYEG